ncbi:MAG: ArsR/SmtB family transcription factor [Oscillospiraceae bacterium]|jgi:DNA-binding transcriptional ArsR family regulator
MDIEKETRELSEELRNTRGILTALGDEVRQHMILVMLQNPHCTGMRVNDIAEKTSLSRPAVSHHLKILKDAGLVKMRKEGTKNFYYFDENTESIDRLIGMLSHARSIMASLPDRSGY